MTFSQTTLDKISQILKSSGFFPMEDFTAVDSLIHSDKSIGFYTLKSCEVAGESISHDGRKFYVETDCVFEIRLMGKSGEFTDFEDFDRLCGNFFEKAVADDDILIKSMKMENVYQSMPLKRLSRNVMMSVRTMIEEDA